MNSDSTRNPTDKNKICSRCNPGTAGKIHGLSGAHDDRDDSYCCVYNHSDR